MDLKNYILEKISESAIFEMADSRQDYLADIRGLRFQILENWCLIRYCNLYDEENYNRLHWSKELCAHLYNLWKVSLKKGLDKLKITEYGFYEKSEFDDIDVIMRILEQKWKIEKLPINVLYSIANDFINELPKICKIISDHNGKYIYDYVHNEI